MCLLLASWCKHLGKQTSISNQLVVFIFFSPHQRNLKIDADPHLVIYLTDSNCSATPL